MSLKQRSGFFLFFLFFFQGTGFSLVSESQPVEIFFTKSSPVEPILLDYLHQAKVRVYAALYDLNLENLAGVLALLKAKGVDVRVVADSDYQSRTSFEILKNAGIPVVFDDRKALMHNKFLVIDGHTVWSGSTNLTPSDLNYNRNNTVVIFSSDLALQFEKEFLEMFQDHLFGQESPVNTDDKKIQVGEFNIQIFFAPETRVDRILERELLSATQTIQVAAFAFTHERLREILEKKSREGVQVEVLLDRGQSKNPESVLRRLKEQKISVRLYQGRGKLHHKFMILDHRKVITGSFNFSKNASLRNDENLLVIENLQAAKLFSLEFESCQTERRN